MRIQFYQRLIFIIITISVLLGCQFLSEGVKEVQPDMPTLPAQQPTEGIEANPPTTSIEVPTKEEPPSYDSEFPLPEDVQNFNKITTGDYGITFMSKMSIDKLITFYRSEFKGQGLTEDELLTAITESSYSLVFRGGKKPIVLQGVDLGGGMITISLRYEDT